MTTPAGSPIIRGEVVSLVDLAAHSSMPSRRRQTLTGLLLVVTMTVAPIAHGSMPRKCCCQTRNSASMGCCRQAETHSSGHGCPHCQHRRQPQPEHGPTLASDSSCQCGCTARPQPLPATRVLVSPDVEVDVANLVVQPCSWEFRNIEMSPFVWTMAPPANGASPQSLFCVWRI